MRHHTQGKLVGLIGFAGSGKDEVAKILMRRFPLWERVAFADKLREFAYAQDPYVMVTQEEMSRFLYEALSTVTVPYFMDGTQRVYFFRLSNLVDAVGWDVAKKCADVRRLLQRTGTEGGRETLYDDVWVEAAVDRVVIPKLNEGRSVVITDCRFANEFDAIKALDGLIVRVRRPGVMAVNNHVSERMAATAAAGYTIDNNGSLADLEYEVVEMVHAMEDVAVITGR